MAVSSGFTLLRSNELNAIRSFWASPQPGPVAGTYGAITGWAGLIKVDGTSYTWIGEPVVNGVTPTLVSQDSFEYTSQRSTFIMTVAGKVTMDVTFISPVTPTDLKKMSIIGTYLSVSVVSRDGATHSVQIYTDTSAGMLVYLANCFRYLNAEFLKMDKSYVQWSCCSVEVSCFIA